MGKLSAGLLGGYSGKVGTTVGAIVKGQPTIRAYQKYVTNPKSARQVQVRNQFVQAKDFVQENMPLCYRKQNMLGYGVKGNFQTAVGAFAKAIDFANMNADAGLLQLPWARKSISNGATFREDLFGKWQGNSINIRPLGFADDNLILYFGSDVRIEGAVVVAGLNDGLPVLKSAYQETPTFNWNIAEVAQNVTGNPSVCGFHLTQTDCGDWTYIYKMELSGAAECGITTGDAGNNFNINIGVIGAYPMESGNCLIDGEIIV